MQLGANYGRRLENSEEEVPTAPRYRVTLTAEERWELEAFTLAATKTTGKGFSFRRSFQDYNWGHVVIEGNSVTARKAYKVEKRSNHGIHGHREALWRMVVRLG